MNSIVGYLVTVGAVSATTVVALTELSNQINQMYLHIAQALAAAGT